MANHDGSVAGADTPITNVVRSGRCSAPDEPDALIPSQSLNEAGRPVTTSKVEGLVAEMQFNRAALSVTVTEGDPAVVTAVGDVDISTVKALEDGLEAAAGDPVEHDVDAELDEVDFMGAAGVRALVNADEEIARGGHRLRIRSVSTMVRRVFDLLGFHHWIRPRR